MKKNKKLNPFLRIFVLMSVLLFIAIVSAIGMYYYVFGITEPEGLSLASWPERFTDNFSLWMENDDGTVKIKEIGLERLDQYGLWLQVIDDEGQEIFCHKKPADYPANYTASELISLRTGAYERGYTVFVNSYEDSGETWSYLIGFPYAIGKHMLYYNGENVGRLSPLFRMGIRIVLCLILLLVVSYGFWLARHLGKIAKGIGNVAMRSYAPLPEKGVFREIYRALNQMDTEIRCSDEAQRDTERMRKEWIANITHDLKTPLSPVRVMQNCLWEAPPRTMRSYRNMAESY